MANKKKQVERVPLIFSFTHSGLCSRGSIKAEDLAYYLKNKDKLQKPLKRKDYVDAFEQIEEAIKNDGGDGDPAPNTDDSIVRPFSFGIIIGNNF